MPQTTWRVNVNIDPLCCLWHAWTYKKQVPIYEDINFVIKEGMISSAQITRNENAYLLTMTVFRSGQPGTDECLMPSPQYGMDCIAEQELEHRELNADEIDRVKVVFSETTVDYRFVSAGMRIESAAPCAIMAWDDFMHCP